MMKLKKAAFNAQPLESGSILRLLAWERKPSYRYVDGKAKPDREHMELWITRYE